MTVFGLFVCLFVCFFIYNPTIEVVTFCLCGCCMLAVFLLPAFTHLGHERQDLLSPCDGKHVCRDWTSVYTLIRKSFGGNGVRTHLNSKGKISLPEKKFSTEDSRTASPTHYRRAIPPPPPPPLAPPPHPPKPPPHPLF